MVKDSSPADIDVIMKRAWKAFHAYRALSLKQRADFMRIIATGLDENNDVLINTAMKETNLPEARLRNEKGRTVFQLRQYADACESGAWLDIKIDTAIPDKTPPKPDIRKMLVPLGPVVVFGASNFPFAYSTAGGDTACAFAAGCPVIVKAHPAHPQTSQMVADIIVKAAEKGKIPEGVFAHVYGASFEVGKILATHPHTKAIGFTGSYTGGKSLFDWANQRKDPIPVFAEMGSVNPVFLLPEKLKSGAADIAKMYAGSITLGAGQFCTNPGIIIGLENDNLLDFVKLLSEEIIKINPATMLHPGIFKNYNEKRAHALRQEEVETAAVSEEEPVGYQGIPTLATVSGSAFINNPVLHEEVFGPYSLIVRCKNISQMQEAAQSLEGQLTCTMMATEADIRSHEELVEIVKNKCGRLVLNGVPTGVEVCLSMHHGGPFPATTDSRFTSVGADGIKRFARPLCYQNWPDELLPLELKMTNPLRLWRTVNNMPQFDISN